MSSPALMPRASSTSDVPEIDLIADMAAATLPKPRGPMAAFLKPKSTPPGTPAQASSKAKAPAVKAPAAKPPAAKPPAVKAKPPASKPAPPKVLGAVPPEDAPKFGTGPLSVSGQLQNKAYVADQSMAKPLTQAAREAPIRLLPVILYHGRLIDRWLLLATQTTEESPLGGGIVYLVSGQGIGQALTSSPLTQQEATSVFAALKKWTPGHAGAAHPSIGSMLWRLKLTFKNFEWETVNVADVKDAIDKLSTHVDVVPLALPPAPSHVLKDLEQLPLSAIDDKEAMKKAVAAWSEKAPQWTPPDGKWPWFPLQKDDPRKDKLGARSDLVGGVMAVTRAPNMGSVATNLPGSWGDGLVKLIGVAPKMPSASPPKPAVVDDEEEAETQALLAPPKPKEKPPPPAKKSKGGKGGKAINPSSFVRGASSALCSDDDSMSEGEPGEEEGEESEDGFIVSDDDVEAGDAVADEKARAARVSAKRKQNMTKDVRSDDDDSDDEEDDEESSEEDEMSDGGSDDGEEEESDDDDDDVMVKATDNASDVDDVMASDDDDEGGKPVAAKKSRLVKASDRKKGKKAVPPHKKKQRILDDDSEGPPPSVLLAQQRLSGERSAGSKPLPKMGAVHSLSASMKARANGMLAKPPKEKSAIAEAIGETDAMFTPTKADQSTPKAPGAPAPSGREPRNDAWKERKRMADNFANIDTRIKAIGGTTGSIIGLSEMGAQLLDTASVNCTTEFDVFREDDHKVPQYNKVIKRLIHLTHNLVSIIEVADGDEKTRKKHDNANAELGTIAAQSLLKVVPQIEALQRAMAEASGITNALVGTSAGMASRIAQATAKKDVVDGNGNGKK